MSRVLNPIPTDRCPIQWESDLDCAIGHSESNSLAWMSAAIAAGERAGADPNVLAALRADVEMIRGAS